MLMRLTPGQRDRIRRLLEAELRAACRSAIDRGAAPAELDGRLTARRRTLAAMSAGDPAETADGDE